MADFARMRAISANLVNYYHILMIRHLFNKFSGNTDKMMKL